MQYQNRDVNYLPNMGIFSIFKFDPLFPNFFTGFMKLLREHFPNYSISEKLEDCDEFTKDIVLFLQGK